MTTHTTTTIGHVTDEDLARALGRGGPGTALADTAPWSFAELRDAARGAERRNGRLVVASGGTSGIPKLTVIRGDMGIPALLRHWSPLRDGDVLLNLFSPGRLWGAHHFYNALGLRSGADVVPMGVLEGTDAAGWAETFADLGVSALAGAPNVLAAFADAMRAAGARLPVRSVVWSGEPMTPGRLRRLRQAFPDAGFWANYGSIETFVVGVNWPECDAGTLHLLPGQILEPDDGGALLTRIDDRWPAPALRYRLGDVLLGASCACHRPDAFRVGSRTNDTVKLFGTRVSCTDVVRQVESLHTVDEAQIVLCGSGAAGTPDRIRVRYTGQAEPSVVRRHLLEGHYGLRFVTEHTPEALAVEHVAGLARNSRTHKVMTVTREPADDVRATGAWDPTAAHPTTETETHGE
ncbi:AMP-binding protein [Myceligenerans xiligouense]|uniref:Phenylacetate-CoA ligase n=1 Tax=Myceligenerans xiligouense TaxID=253184 RepID=A0A3N4YI09_9MICO|nr:AMP-binding protein [Myceligenerans xiligouense]RPF20749.1 phenylacetate-CoA ligase [Myceligenerans xiligouense]